MGTVIAAVVVGVVLVGIGILLGRRMRGAGEPVFGTPVAMSTPSRPPRSTDEQPRADAELAPPELGRLTEGLRAAAADGELTDDEIQHLLPGADVTRQGDGVIVTSTSSSTSHRIQGPDGQTYDSIDDVPDPELRERLRRLLGDLGDAGG
jgi:hypothetical protein